MIRETLYTAMRVYWEKSKGVKERGQRKGWWNPLGALSACKAEM